MPRITFPSKKNVWQTICAEYEAARAVESLDADMLLPALMSSANNDSTEYDAATHSPVFCGYSFSLTRVDDDRLLTFDSSIASLASYGHNLETIESLDKRHHQHEQQQQQQQQQQHQKQQLHSTPFVEQSPINRMLMRSSAATATTTTKSTLTQLPGAILLAPTNNEREYIELVVFPILLHALELMLNEAKTRKCFERKRTAFNACDFITDYLYKNNPLISASEAAKRRSITFWQIPFVQQWLVAHPRPPLPMSLIWSDEEACVRIQAFFRGYLVRRDPEVQELRKWQRELREENQNIGQRVEQFWNDSSASKSNGLIGIQPQEPAAATTLLLSK